MFTSAFIYNIVRQKSYNNLNDKPIVVGLSYFRIFDKVSGIIESMENQNINIDWHHVHEQFKKDLLLEKELSESDDTFFSIYDVYSEEPFGVKSQRNYRLPVHRVLNNLSNFDSNNELIPFMWTASEVLITAPNNKLDVSYANNGNLGVLVLMRNGTLFLIKHDYFYRKYLLEMFADYEGPAFILDSWGDGGAPIVRNISEKGSVNVKDERTD